VVTGEVIGGVDAGVTEEDVGMGKDQTVAHADLSIWMISPLSLRCLRVAKLRRWRTWCQNNVATTSHLDMYLFSASFRFSTSVLNAAVLPLSVSLLTCL
jgi:hypothetical protein